eukprot:GEMP01003345.1.p1 GENE.GEMP01003345.1~~GEMP01003345.1.p1  ORF type:complete len:1288 (+),score=226.69 GEMP01003345.1:118-3981(+)
MNGRTEPHGVPDVDVGPSGLSLSLPRRGGGMPLWSRSRTEGTLNLSPPMQDAARETPQHSPVPCYHMHSFTSPTGTVPRFSPVPISSHRPWQFAIPTCSSPTVNTRIATERNFQSVNAEQRSSSTRADSPSNEQEARKADPHRNKDRRIPRADSVDRRATLHEHTPSSRIEQNNDSETRCRLSTDLEDFSATRQRMSPRRLSMEPDIAMPRGTHASVDKDRFGAWNRTSLQDHEHTPTRLNATSAFPTAKSYSNIEGKQPFGFACCSVPNPRSSLTTAVIDPVQQRYSLPPSNLIVPLPDSPKDYPRGPKSPAPIRSQHGEARKSRLRFTFNDSADIGSPCDIEKGRESLVDDRDTRVRGDREEREHTSLLKAENATSVGRRLDKGASMLTSARISATDLPSLGKTRTSVKSEVRSPRLSNRIAKPRITWHIAPTTVSSPSSRLAVKRASSAVFSRPFAVEKNRRPPSVTATILTKSSLFSCSSLARSSAHRGRCQTGDTPGDCIGGPGRVSASKRGESDSLSVKLGSDALTAYEWHGIYTVKEFDGGICALLSRIITCTPMQGVMLACVFLTCFLHDAAVVAQFRYVKFQDGILGIILLLFLTETLLLSLLATGYAGKLYFWLDIVVMSTLVFDITSITGMYDKVEHHMSLETGMYINFSWRAYGACRFFRIVKMVRYSSAIFTCVYDRCAGTRQHQMYDLWRKLSQRMTTHVAIFTTLLLAITPFFDSGVYHEDYSISFWMEKLVNCVPSSCDQNATITDFGKFYEDRGASYFPFDVTINGTNHPIQSAPARKDSIIQITGADRTVEANFDFSRPRVAQSVLIICLTCGAIFAIFASAFLLSFEVSLVVFDPLEKLLERVHGIMRDVFTTEMDAEEKGEHTFILENVIKRLAAIGRASVKKTHKLELGFVGYTFKHADDNSPEALPDSFNDAAAPESPLEINIDTWAFNPFTLSKSENTRVAEWILYYSPSCRTRIPNGEKEVRRFVSAVQRGYFDSNPYHNWHHAVDVTQAVFYVINKLRLHSFLPWHERAALAVSALAHDVGHIARNNNFLIQNHHELALLYNDRSPLENMHCAMLFEILSFETKHVFKHLSRKMFCDVRQVCIESILSTDNALHFSLVNELDIFATVNTELFTHAWNGYATSWTPEAISAFSTNVDRRKMLWKIVLHWADISNPVRPFDICQEWSYRIMEEFFVQGDHEKYLGHPVGLLNDRDVVDIPTGQIGFIEYVVFPFANAIARILEPASDFSRCIIQNAERWCQLVDDEDQEATLLERVRRIERQLR